MIEYVWNVNLSLLMCNEIWTGINVYVLLCDCSIPPMSNYSLSNNIAPNPACLQSTNTSSYSCMLPGKIYKLTTKDNAQSYIYLHFLFTTINK